MINIKEHKLSYSFFSSVKDKYPKEENKRIVDIFGLKHGTSNIKENTPCISPALYLPNRTRSKDGVESITALFYDFDDLNDQEVKMVSEAIKESKLASVIYSTFKNKISWKGKHHKSRFRVVIFPERPISPQEFREIYEEQGRKLFKHLYDSSCAEVSRLFLKPLCPQIGIEHSYIVYINGDLLKLTCTPNGKKQEIVLKSQKKSEIKSDDKCVNSFKEIIANKGGRNNALTSIAGTLLSRGLNSNELEEVLQSINSSLNEDALEENEVSQICESMKRYENSFLEFSVEDLENAERFKTFLNGNFKYIQEKGTWFYWDDIKWKIDSNGEITRNYRDYIRELESEADMLNGTQRDNAIDLISELKSNKKINATKKLLMDLEEVTQSIGEFDQIKELLTFKNGLLDLKSGELLKHDKSKLLTKYINSDFKKGSKCPMWERFLHEIFQGDIELIKFIQRALGYSITGFTDEQVLFFLIGQGENGKSTFGNVISNIFESISSQADFNTFIESKSERIRNDIARLSSSRIVFASESSPDKYLDEGAIKQMTGGEKITARFLFKEFFEFRPQFKIWLIANQFPLIKQNDHALWRRIIPICIDYKVPKEKKDPFLEKKLLSEREGIISWVVNGTLSWMKEGLNPPRIISNFKREIKTEADEIKQFIDERCHLLNSGKCKSSDLFQAYKNWSEAEGYIPRTVQVFTKRLKDLGLIQKRDSKSRYWIGVSL